MMYDQWQWLKIKIYDIKKKARKNKRKLENNLNWKYGEFNAFAEIRLPSLSVSTLKFY